MIGEAFQSLVRCCDELEKSLGDFRQVIAEDKPDNDDLALVDIFGDVLDDLLGRMHEMHEAAQSGYRSAEGRNNLEQTRQILITCHKQFIYILQQFRFELSHFERIEQMVQLRRKRSGHWRTWVGSVKVALIQCEQPLFEVQQALFRCWQEITERGLAVGTAAV